MCKYCVEPTNSQIFPLFWHLKNRRKHQSICMTSNSTYSFSIFIKKVAKLKLAIIKSLPVWHDSVKRLVIDPVVMRSSPATGHKMYVVHCWLINPNKFNLRSWLLAY